MKSKINKLIAIYEMIGGICGIYILIMHSAPSTENYHILSLVIYIYIFIVYVSSLIGGFLLYIQKRKGLVVSVFTQIFQIPYIITSSCIYCVVSGLLIMGGVEALPSMVKISGKFGLEAYFRMYFGNVVTGSFIGINLIPVIIIIYIRRIQKIEKISQLEYQNEMIRATDDI